MIQDDVKMNQLQIGKDIRVKLQTHPFFKWKSPQWTIGITWVSSIKMPRQVFSFSFGFVYH
jgi:hypothetical protein